MLSLVCGSTGLLEDGRLAERAAAEAGIDLVELALHALDPVAGSFASDLVDAAGEFALALLRLADPAVADVVVALDGELRADVQSGQDGGIEAEREGSAEDSVRAEDDVAALLQAPGALNHVSAGVFQPTEGRAALLHQVAETGSAN